MEWVFEFGGYCFMAAVGALAWAIVSSARDHREESKADSAV